MALQSYIIKRLAGVEKINKIRPKTERFTPKPRRYQRLLAHPNGWYGAIDNGPVIREVPDGVDSPVDLLAAPKPLAFRRL